MIAKHESAGRPRRVWVSKSGAGGDHIENNFSNEIHLFF